MNTPAKISNAIGVGLPSTNGNYLTRGGTGAKKRVNGILISGRADNINDLTNLHLYAGFDSLNVADLVNVEFVFYRSDAAPGNFNIDIDGSVAAYVWAGAWVLVNTPHGNVTVTWQEIPTGIGNMRKMVGTIYNLAAGRHTLSIYTTATVPAAGVSFGLGAALTGGFSNTDVTNPSSVRVAEYLTECGWTHLGMDFLKFRSEMLVGVGPEQHMKSYAPLIYEPGTAASFLGVNALSTDQVMGLTRIVCAPETWASIYDQKGLITKLYHDVGLLLALSTSTDSR
jgi:hypothetical protein